MLVLNGYFDGNTVRTFEPIVAQKNQKVTLTVLDDFVEETGIHHLDDEIIDKYFGMWQSHGDDVCAEEAIQKMREGRHFDF